MDDGYGVVPSADVSPEATIGPGCSVWHLAQIREGAVLGGGCVVGRGAYIGSGVVLGDHCKVQNYALVYEPAVLGDGVFVGPAAVLTNDSYPRAVTPAGELKSASDWHAVGVVVGDGASIGARAVCIAPVRVGAWAMVGAGSVVTRDVSPFALVVGVPARRVGWVGKAGVPLRAVGPVEAEASDGERVSLFECPVTGARYIERDGRLYESEKL